MVSVTVTEPRFSAEDVQLLIQSRRDRDAPLSRSGLPLSEATDPANQYAFEVPLPTIDFAQTELERAQKHYRDKYPHSDQALVWSVRRKTAP